ncbi:MAG: epoxyqueuosine reductase QueG [Phormidesmis priestleyi Ana]|uniref:Epoxyqueuosine reductase n=1 Tax=Phormidesmis priestleyi Ana TaxID=1666911 RepID=A0A0P7Z411_9CYAN|nr:MAG: epoxyqueuosine reductase QueG [Phormidesmis priestleyi Ana]
MAKPNCEASASSDSDGSDDLVDSERVKQKAIALGFHQVGIATISDQPTAAEQSAKTALAAWLAQGFQADMAWMESDKRKDIRRVMPAAKSIICVGLNYYTGHQRPDGNEYAKISRYGWGRDYHRVLTKKLKQLSSWLQLQKTDQNTKVEARLYADTGPVQDKFWAQQAGLGWIAKNGNLINRHYGSWIFLGEVITNLALLPDRPHMAHCGNCTRCLTACPTEAIRAPGVVDANRCIAYHTIENRAEVLPAAIANHLQGWVAGCDICQDVCPWNQRFAQKTDVEAFEPYAENIAPTLQTLANITEAEWNRRFPASALRRIKPAMLRRNAQAALAANQVATQESSSPEE